MLQALALVGLTLVVVRGSLFAPIKSVALFGCARCFGFWVGMLGAIVVDRGAWSYDAAVRWALSAGLVSLGATAFDFGLAWLDGRTSPR